MSRIASEAAPTVPLRRRRAARILPLLALAALGSGAAAAPVDLPWNEPILRLASSDYRSAMDEQTRLRRVLATLPEAPRNQQSGRLGFQAFRPNWAPNSFSVWVEVELPEESALDAVVLVPVDAPYRDFPGPGYGFPVRFRVELIGAASPNVIADHVAQPFANPGNLPVWIPATGHRAQRVRVTMTEPWTNRDPLFVFALGEIIVLRGNRNLAAGARVTASEQFESVSNWGKSNLTDNQSILGPPVAAESSASRGYHSTIVDQADIPKWVQVDLGGPTELDEVRVIGATGRILPGRPGFGFPLRFKIEAADDPDFLRPVMIADHTAADFPNPASNPVTFQTRRLRTRYVRVTATKLWERAENFTFALAELQVYSGDKNVALGRPVAHLDSYPGAVTWAPPFLTDGFSSEKRLTEWPAWLRGLSRRREMESALAAVEQTAEDARLAAVVRMRYFVWLAGLLGTFGVLGVVWRVRRARERALQQLRQRIASDLHDEIGSNLGSIALLSEIGLQHEGSLVRADLEEIWHVARQTADSMRDIVELIQRPAASGEEFVAKLREVASRLLAGLEWTFTACPGLELPSLTAQRHLLLAFKEALHNIRKHAAARRVTVELAWHERRLLVKISDDGIGFAPVAVTDGHGLANLRHRAAALGGEARIESTPGQGTTVTFFLDPRVLRTAQS